MGEGGSRHALVLVGHGSHLSPESSAPVFAHAQHIRALGIFDQVVEGFWKEEPSLRDVLDLVSADETWVVPVFLAEGYFTREVVPREMGLAGAVTTHHSAGRVRYCPPIGTHPSMAELILSRARSLAELDSRKRRDTALLLIGHGTERSSTSGGTVYALVEQLRALGEFGAVECGFLDEAPYVGDVLATLDAEDIVLVPFFVAEGWHTRTTIPEDLGLTGPVTLRDARRIWYTPPVGTLDQVAQVVLATAADAGAPLAPAHLAAQGTAPSQASGSSIDRARDAFFIWLDEAGPTGRTFLQLWIATRHSGRYEIRHTADSHRPLQQLTTRVGLEGARSIARTTSDGTYRPLRSAADLMSGWALTNLDPDQLWLALSSIYPAAVLHWHRAQADSLETVSYARWASRQSGIYSGLVDLPESRGDEAIGACCERRRCLRTRLWHLEPHQTLPVLDTSAVPCVEPCTLFASAARELLLLGSTLASQSPRS